MAARKKASKAKPKASKVKRRAPASTPAPPDELEELPDLPDDLEDMDDLDALPDIEGLDARNTLDFDLTDDAMAVAAELVPDLPIADPALQTLPVDDPLSTLPVADVAVPVPVMEEPELDELEELPTDGDDTLLEIGGATTEAPAAPAPQPAGPPEKTLPSDAPEEFAVLPDDPTAADDRMVRARGSLALITTRCAALEEQIGSTLLAGTDAIPLPAGGDELVERGRRLRGPHAEGADRAANARAAADTAAAALAAAKGQLADHTARRDAAVAQLRGTGEMLADHLLGAHQPQIARLAGKKLPDALAPVVAAVARLVEIDGELDDLDASGEKTGKLKKGQKTPKQKLRGERDTVQRTARTTLIGIGTGSFPLVDALAKGCAACASSRATLAEAADRVETAEAGLRTIDIPALAGAAATTAREAAEIEAREQANDTAWQAIAPRVGRLWLQQRAEQSVAADSEEERLWRDVDRNRQQLEGYVDALVLHCRAAQAEAAANQTERLEQAVAAARAALEELHRVRSGADEAAQATVASFDARRAEVENNATQAVAAVAQAADRARQDGEAALASVLEQFRDARARADTAHQEALAAAEAHANASVERVSALQAKIDQRVGELTALTARLDAADARVAETVARVDGLAERIPDAEALDQRTREASARVDELSTKVEWATTETQEAARQVADVGATVGDLVGAVNGPIEAARQAVGELVEAFGRDVDASREALATSEQKTRQKRAQQTEELVASVQARVEKAMAAIDAAAGRGRPQRPAPPAAAPNDDDEIELEPIEDDPPPRPRGRDRARSDRGRRLR